MVLLGKTDLQRHLHFIYGDLYIGVFEVSVIFDADSDRRENLILDYFELCDPLSRCAIYVST